MVQITKEQIDAVLVQMDLLITNGQWVGSNFLLSLGKSVNEARDNFLHQVGRSVSNEDTNINAEEKMQTLPGNKLIVYVVLYSSFGDNLQSWERMLFNLPKQSVSRPIYAEEEQVITILKSKEVTLNDAYVSVMVDKDDILSMPEDKIPLDKLGQQILTLKDNVIKLDNIRLFYNNGNTYSYSRSRLIKK
jgi:intracellular multiplication protein IcmQ